MLFELKIANDWLHLAGKRPRPGALFDHFWQEGELAVLFGEFNIGKSLLAVQIAESVARGNPIGSLQLDAPPQKVIFLDFERSAKHFQMRYSPEPDAGGDSLPREAYRFSDNLIRIEADLNAQLPDGSPSSEEHLVSSLERVIAETGARVLIIDSLNSLGRTGQGTRAGLAFMTGLNRLRRRHDLSVLVLVHTLPRSSSSSRGLSLSDLQAWKILTAYAGSIFAVGRSSHEPATRYVKQVLSRSAAQVGDSSAVPTFCVARIGGNFLGFEYLRLAPKAAHLQPIGNTCDWKMIEEIRDMHDEGLSIREIAAELGISKSAVHRMVHMRPPAAGMQEEIEIEPEPKASKYDFPGCEEYDEAADDPRFEVMFEREDDQAHLLRREYYLIHAARARARRQYESTGISPPLRDDPDYSEFMQSLSADEKQNGDAADPQARNEQLNAGAPVEYPGGDSPSAQHNGGSPGPAPPPHPILNLPRRLDNNGKEIFVEQVNNYDDPLSWYTMEEYGHCFRHTRSGGIRYLGRIIDTPPAHDPNIKHPP